LSYPTCHNSPQEQETTIHAAGEHPGTKRSIRSGVAQSVKAKPLTIQEAPPLKNSFQIQAAEYWLKLGEAD
jgi:hypothetical protein